jgi:hypothetical protein
MENALKRMKNALKGSMIFLINLKNIPIYDLLLEYSLIAHQLKYLIFLPRSLVGINPKKRVYCAKLLSLVLGCQEEGELGLARLEALVINPV